MAVLVVASKRDVAGQNIVNKLLEAKKFTPAEENNALLKCENVYLKQVENESIFADDLGVGMSFDAVIFASKHRSESGEPALTAHWTGNATSRADFGGKPKSLSLADPPRLRAALKALDEAREGRELNYAVTLEATHHGPTELNMPTLFVEVGSTEKEWSDLKAAGAAAEAIWKAATEPLPGKNAVGFGGGHYCNKQTQAMRKENFAFGHILSKYFFDEYDPSVVRLAFSRSMGDCRTAVVDWKGVRGSERAKLLDTLKEMGVEIVRV